MVVTLICAVFFGEQTTSITPIFKGVAGEVPTWSDYGKALGLCLIAVSFSFGGYQQSINFGGEAKEAKKVIPRSIIIGLGIIITLYLSIAF